MKEKIESLGAVAKRMRAERVAARKLAKANEPPPQPKPPKYIPFRTCETTVVRPAPSASNIAWHARPEADSPDPFCVRALATVAAVPSPEAEVDGADGDWLADLRAAGVVAADGLSLTEVGKRLWMRTHRDGSDLPGWKNTFCRDELLGRGWTDHAIKTLLKWPDGSKPNPRDPRFPDMVLYHRDRVELAERGEEFRQLQESRAKRKPISGRVKSPAAKKRPARKRYVVGDTAESLRNFETLIMAPTPSGCPLQHCHECGCYYDIENSLIDDSRPPCNCDWDDDEDDD